MTVCAPIKTKPFRVCIGDLKHRIEINTRSIISPTGNGVDYSETFTSPKIVWAMIETSEGTTIFDDTNTEQNITHKFYIRYIPNLTFEAWVKFENQYYDIVRVENLNHEKRFCLILACIRGSINKPVNWS